MRDFSSVEEAYEAIAAAIVQFPAGRPWESAYAKFSLLSKMFSVEWGVVVGTEVDRKGSSPPRAFVSDCMDAAAFLKSDLLQKTGERIWGLIFTLNPEGSFKIQYDYNKPEGYEETDETIDVSLSDFAEKVNKGKLDA